MYSSLAVMGVVMPAWQNGHKVCEVVVLLFIAHTYRRTSRSGLLTGGFSFRSTANRLAVASWPSEGI